MVLLLLSILVVLTPVMMAASDSQERLDTKSIVKRLKSDDQLESWVPRTFIKYAKEGWGNAKRRIGEDASEKKNFNNDAWEVMLNIVYGRIKKMSETLRPPKEQHELALNALMDMGKHAVKRNTARSKPLLCAVFLSANPTDMTILKNNLKRSNDGKSVGCDWAVTFYAGDADIIKEFLDDVQTHGKFPQVVKATQYTGKRGNDGIYVPKPYLYHSLKEVVKPYQRLWVLDADISLAEFSFAKLHAILSCAEWYDDDSMHSSSKRHPSLPPGPIIAQPVISSRANFYSSLTAPRWQNKVGNAAVHVGQHTGFVEQMMPLFVTDFYEWYMEYIVEPWLPVSLEFEATWGFDTTWCGAAADFAYYSSNHWERDESGRSSSSSSSSSSTSSSSSINPRNTNTTNVPFACGLFLYTDAVQHLNKNKGSQMNTKHGNGTTMALFRFSGHMMKMWVHDYHKEWLTPTKRAFPNPEGGGKVGLVSKNRMDMKCAQALDPNLV